MRKALIRLACMRGWRAGTSACRLSHERALRIGLGPILQTSRSSSMLFSQACRKSARKATSIDAIVRLLRPRKSRNCLAAAIYLSSVPAVNFSRLFLRRASGYFEKQNALFHYLLRAFGTEHSTCAADMRNTENVLQKENKSVRVHVCAYAICTV